MTALLVMLPMVVIAFRRYVLNVTIHDRIKYDNKIFAFDAVYCTIKVCFGGCGGNTSVKIKRKIKLK